MNSILSKLFNDGAKSEIMFEPDTNPLLLPPLPSKFCYSSFIYWIPVIRPYDKGLAYILR